MQNTFFAGRDGFVWWFGVVEDRNDPKALGRVRCRVYGYHTEDKTKLPTIDLPWAYCVQPANSASSGGVGSSPTGPIEGTWVIGFWRDPDFMQEPMVWGTLPGINSSNAAPSGESPHDFSPEQQLDPPSVSSNVAIANGTTVSFETPTDTTDSTVLVKINGVVQSASNTVPESPNNVEQPLDDFYGGGTSYSASDFASERYGERIARKINELAPEVRDRFAKGVQSFLSSNPDYDLSIAHAYRTIAQQKELYRKYKSGGPKAASPGSSWHNYASAIDLVIIKDGRADWTDSLYTGIARSAFSGQGLVNEISGDAGHFYPAAFGKSPDRRLRNGTITVAEFAAEKGLA
jgi:hypothetical protein